jgi:hypothetical protein
MTEKEQQKRSILLIHGRDFKPAAAAYLKLAATAMRAGLERDFPDCVECFDQLSIDLAWYGDMNADVLQRKGKTYDESLDVGDRQNALRALREIAPRKRFGIRAYDKLPGKSALPEFFMDVSAPLLGAVGFRMPVLGKIAKDFAGYLNGLEFAEEAALA